MSDPEHIINPPMKPSPPWPPPGPRAGGVASSAIAVVMLASGRGDLGLLFTGLALVIGVIDLVWTFAGRGRNGTKPQRPNTY